MARGDGVEERIVGKGAYFHVIEDSAIVLRTKGIYRQTSAYLRGDVIYARYGSGFIRVMKSGTSHPDVHVDAMDLPFKPRVGKLGVYTAPPTYKPAEG